MTAPAADRPDAGPVDGPRALLRGALVDPAALVRAVITGRRKGHQVPWRRVELRYVDLKAGVHLQTTSYDERQAHTANHPLAEAGRVVDDLLDAGYATWHVETITHVHQGRIGKRGDVRVRTDERDRPVEVRRDHDRAKQRLLAEDDPVLVALGISTHDGRVKPSRQAKYRQVEEFLRLLDGSVADALASGALRRPTADDPLRIVDLGCGNAYLTLCAHRFLTDVRGLPVRLTGVDVRPSMIERNASLAAGLGLDADFVAGGIADVALEPAPEVVLALHACDTATDDALARAVGWDSPLVLAAPCCHHDVAAQLRRSPAPAPYAGLTADGILRERFADTLTDALRASLLRGLGYRVEVVEFVESAHTPRNTLLRAVRSGRPDPAEREAADRLAEAWGISPRLAVLVPGARP